MQKVNMLVKILEIELRFLNHTHIRPVLVIHQEVKYSFSAQFWQNPCPDIAFEA